MPDIWKSKFGAVWCALMHDSPMWPIHGRYQCRTCGRLYPAPWGQDEGPGAARPGAAKPAHIRPASLLPLIITLLMLHASPMRAADARDVAGSVAGPTAGQRSDFAAGKAYYGEGEFKRAVARFRRALEVNPNDADSYYWMGVTYQTLADLAAPLDSKYRSRARFCLTRATELAPARPDYRRELFDFLLDGAGSPPASFRRQAADILRSISESDPDYLDLRRRFDDQKRATSSAEARLGGLFLAAPRAAYRIVDLPGSLIRRGAALPITARQ